jgi:hypothetical protein
MALPDSTDQMTQPLQVAGLNDQTQPQAVTQAAQPNQSPTTPVTTTQVTPAQVPSPHAQHVGRFATILSRIAGGDQQVVRDQQGQPVVNPQTGQVVTRTMTKRSLGASILAGALSAMAANEANQPYRNGNGVWVNPSNQAVAAGDQAFQQSRPRNQIREAQQQANNQRTQQYATYQQNVNMFKLAHEISHMKAEDKAAGVAAFASTYDAAENGDIPGYDTTLGDLSEKEAGEKLQNFDPTSHMMVPNGKTVPVLDQHGNPTGETEIRFMILPGQDGKIPLTKEMIQDHKELTGAAEGQTIPLTQWAKLVTSASSKNVLGSMLNTVGQSQNAAFPNKDYKGFDLNQFLKDSKATPKQIQDLGHLSRLQNDPDKFAEGLGAIDTTGQMDAALRKQGIGISGQDWAKKRAGELAEEKLVNPDKQPADAGYMVQLQTSAKELGLTPGQTNDILSEVPAKDATRAQVAKAHENIRAQQNTNTTQALAKSNAQSRQTNPDDVDVLADQLLIPNNLTAMKDIGGRGNQRTQILAAAARKAKERGIPFDIGVVNQRVKFLGEYEDPKGRAATNRQAINNVLQHAGDLSDLNEANRRSNVKILNTPVNALKDQFGNQTYTQYQTASGVLKDELALYFAGGYAPSKDQQEMWNKIQSDTATPAQTEAFAKEVVRLAARRANTFNEQFKTNMGYDDPNMITPAAKAAAEHLGMGDIVSKFGSGGQLGQRPATQQPSRVVPAGAIAGRDANGNIIGYKTADGKVVRF